jgi:hypothetical protein
LRWYGNKEMNVILIMVRLFDVQLRVEGGDFEEFPIEILPEFWGDNGVAIFGRKDDVIVAEVDAMIVPSIFLCVCHPFIISGRGELDTETHSIPGLTPRGIFV